MKVIKTKKELLNKAELLNAIDITNLSNEEVNKIKKDKTIYKSFGKYGINAMIFQDDKEKYYLIKERVSNLFYFA
ncbi:hypothetical protein [Campylobacter ureolyticus]|uniref:hypothetical protein n=1 Tax=Campylobacter ureolyticus TaxID=827 RepID=UPI0022B33B04|nr:hypothetical protein [Campylobacter ureolyticus]MCZ6104705.1 hypothetical protein [Campylobacter ureolyticus]MCZ6157319.1 hypothetical protein [Campylobacter ureolyticus]